MMVDCEVKMDNNPDEPDCEGSVEVLERDLAAGKIPACRACLAKVIRVRDELLRRKRAN